MYRCVRVDPPSDAGRVRGIQRARTGLSGARSGRIRLERRAGRGQRGELTAADVVIVNIDANFSRELLVGEADFYVSLRRIGRTSFTLETSIGQGGTIASVATFTVAYIRDGAPAPLSDRFIEFLRVLEV